MNTKEERKTVRAWLLLFHPEARWEMVEHEPGDIPSPEEVDELAKKTKKLSKKTKKG